MESSYSIAAEESLVRLKVWGEVTADGMIALAREAGADPRFVPGMCAIADLREAHGSWDYSEIQRFRDYVTQVEVPGEVRWAAVVKSGALIAVAHVLIVISEAVGARIHIRCFEDPAVALRWVRGADEVRSP